MVRVHFDMEARTVRANNKVEADRGCISIERGPIVYCAEWPDNQGFDIMSILENREPQFAEGKLSYDGFIDPKYKNVYVNLFLSNSSSLKVAGKKVSLSQDTQYPWNGDIAIKVDDNKAGQFGMKIRIPGWVKGQPVPSDLYYYSDGTIIGIV